MNINQFIDHTLLKPNTTKEQIQTLCKEAKDNSFMAVCVNSTYVKLASEELKGSNVKVCTVVGFPLGASPKEVKSLEAKIAIENGAKEIDMVINIGELKNQNYALVQEDIKMQAQTCHANNAILKVIIETCLLTEEEKVKACQLSKEAGADYVKTSTGFSTGGATLEDVKLMRATVGPELGVKASGGVRDLQAAKDMIEAGATRLGTSSGVKIVNGEVSTSSY